MARRRARFREGDWTYVVLQEQSQRPVVDWQSFYKFSREFDIVIRESGAETVLLMTWERPDSVAGGVTTASLASAYDAVGAQLGAGVAPAGLAFARSLLQRPDLPLYSQDGHPTEAGTYLAACVLYGVIFQKTPVGNSYVGPGVTRTMPPSSNKWRRRRLASEVGCAGRAPDNSQAPRRVPGVLDRHGGRRVAGRCAGLPASVPHDPGGPAVSAGQQPLDNGGSRGSRPRAVDDPRPGDSVASRVPPPTLFWAALLIGMVVAGCGSRPTPSAPLAAPPSPTGTAERPASTPTSSIVVAAQVCTPTLDDGLSPSYRSDTPARSVVGRGHVLTGTVRSSRDCAPIANAQLELWPEYAGQGHVDDARATVFTGADGRYRFECDLPEHIHMRISAPGYITIAQNSYHPEGQAQGTFDVVLSPET